MTITITRNLPDGITSVVLEPLHDPIKHYLGCNPFHFMNIGSTLQDLLDFFNAAAMLETNMYTSRENDAVRRNASQQPNVPQFGQLTDSFSETRKGVDASGREITSESLRARARFIVPFSYLIWIPMLIIVYSPKRDSLFASMQEGQQIPSVMSQFAQKVRNSKTPQCHTFVSGTFGELNPSIQDKISGTFFDREFLLSDAGFQSYCSFLNWLQSNSGNYVKFETLTSSNRARLIPRLESGHQCTFGALNCHPDGALLSRVELRPNNSYPSSIKDTNFLDAGTIHASLYIDAGLKTQVLRNRELSSFFVDHNSTQNYHSYVLERINGTIVNSSGMTPDYHDDMQKQKETKLAKILAKDVAGISPGKKTRKKALEDKPSGESSNDFSNFAETISLLKLLIQSRNELSIVKNFLNLLTKRKDLILSFS